MGRALQSVASLRDYSQPSPMAVLTNLAAPMTTLQAKPMVKKIYSRIRVTTNWEVSRKDNANMKGLNQSLDSLLFAVGLHILPSH